MTTVVSKQSGREEGGEWRGRTEGTMCPETQVTDTSQGPASVAGGLGAALAAHLSPTNSPPAAVDTRGNTEPPRRFHTPDLLRPRIPIPNRIHAGFLPACQTQRASELQLHSPPVSPRLRPRKKRWIWEPSGRHRSVRRGSQDICRVDSCIYRRWEQRPKVGAGVPVPSPPLRSSFMHT